MPKGMGRQSTDPLVKTFVLRVREIERDARTERSMYFSESHIAELVEAEAKAHGFFTKLFPTIGRARRPDQMHDHLSERFIPSDASEITDGLVGSEVS